MSVLALLSARSALETTRNTGVAPTRALYFDKDQSSWEQNVATIAPQEARNSFFEQYRVYPGIERDKITIAGDLTYDDAVFWGQVMIKGGVTAVGAGADKTWTYTPSASTDDIKSFTLQWASTDSISSATGWSLVGCLGSTWEVHWKKDSVVTHKMEILSAKGATQISAFTGSATDRVNISAVGPVTQVWVDTSTIGTTADPNILEATWKLDNKWTYLDTLDATNVAAQIIRPDMREWTLDVVRYFADKTELTAYLAKTERKVRVQSLGPTLGGSAYRIRLDAYGYWDLNSYANVNGLIVANMTLANLYDATATTDFTFEAVSALTAIS